MSSALFLFQVLPEEVRAANSIRSASRLDLTHASNEIGYRGLEAFRSPKGQIYLNLAPSRELIAANARHRAEYCLTDGRKNLTSIFVEPYVPHCGFGYPNSRPKLRNGDANPLLPFKNDAFLFQINRDYTSIEMLVMPGERHHVTYHYERLVEGEHDSLFDSMRDIATLFFPYQGLK